jgi:hypothetical protein
VQRPQHEDDDGADGEEALRYVHQAFPLCGLTLSISGGAQRRPLHAVVRRFLWSDPEAFQRTV